jgi:hypothetical protein
LTWQGINFNVLNISESGLKIEIQSNPDMRSDSHVFNGYLCLSNGEQVPISGEQVWIIGNEIGINLNEPISKKIFDSDAGCFQISE